MNFDLANLSPENMKNGSYKPSGDLTPYSKSLPAIAEFELPPHEPPAQTANRSIDSYRTAPKLLSEYGLFEGDGSSQQPAREWCRTH